MEAPTCLDDWNGKSMNRGRPDLERMEMGPGPLNECGKRVVVAMRCQCQAGTSRHSPSRGQAGAKRCRTQGWRARKEDGNSLKGQGERKQKRMDEAAGELAESSS